ncbi:MAG: hypothetical protein Q9190_002337 [Brigantiaea leucoxantha]
MASADICKQCLAPRLVRFMATETELPTMLEPPKVDVKLISNPSGGLQRRVPPKKADVLTTIYNFPSMEPSRFAYYPANHLDLPLRRDILHRAVIFEGDATRQGTASTKWRADVHGSGRKIRPQKGTGQARLGDKKSPMLKGGGVAFGPHPRDFSTKLPRKIYDLAWRTALSHRYKHGDLIVLENNFDLEMDEPRWLAQIMKWNHLGHKNGGCVVVTRKWRENLFQAFEARNPGDLKQGMIKTEEDVDVKDLLKLGKLMIEKRSLDSLLKEHSSDLDRTVPSAVYI